MTLLHNNPLKSQRAAENRRPIPPGRRADVHERQAHDSQTESPSRVGGQSSAYYVHTTQRQQRSRSARAWKAVSKAMHAVLPACLSASPPLTRHAYSLIRAQVSKKSLQKEQESMMICVGEAGEERRPRMVTNSHNFRAGSAFTLVTRSYFCGSAKEGMPAGLSLKPTFLIESGVSRASAACCRRRRRGSSISGPLSRAIC